MKHDRVFFSEEAQKDLLDLYEYIAARDGSTQAIRYISRIETWCDGLRTFPKRGTLRDDVRPGVRVIGFEHRVTIAFEVASDRVIILRILYAGRTISGDSGTPEE